MIGGLPAGDLLTQFGAALTGATLTGLTVRLAHHRGRTTHPYQHPAAVTPARAALPAAVQMCQFCADLAAGQVQLGVDEVALCDPCQDDVLDLLAAMVCHLPIPGRGSRDRPPASTSTCPASPRRSVN